MKIYNKFKYKYIIDKLNNNELCILPTDTVYGIMGIFSKENEKRINLFKKRDADQKVSVIFYNKKEMLKYVENLSKSKTCLIKKLLPGKYTFIVNLNKDFVNLKGFDRNDFGVRITKNKILQKIIKKTGPLLATSCNESGKEICLSKSDIIKSFGNTNISVMYTTSLSGKASTIYDLTEDEIITIRK